VKMRAFDVAITGICAALYATVGFLTSFGLSLGGVAFWPAAVIPAIFAVLFGPWTGATGASIGIFIRDMLYHGNPLLSLTAGVTSNFVMFFIIGYVSNTNLTKRKLSLGVIIGAIIALSGILLPTILLPTESANFTVFSTSVTVALFVLLVGTSLLLFLLITRYWREFRKFGVGAVIGQGVGAAIVAIGVWAYSQLFYSPTGYFTAPIQASFVPIVFVWTFATEIPFVLLLGPPIIKACYLAFPNLRSSRKTEKREK
jgi:uncharacterized membrane protein